MAWAYPGLVWRPMPDFLAYQEYTTSLDHMDAAFLRSPRAPERILNENPAGYEPDDHLAAFDAPATQLEILCDYGQVATQAQWQVLTQVPDRCGPSRRLAVVHAAQGQEVTVPGAAPDEIVIARIRGLTSSWLDQARLLAWRLPSIHIDLVATGELPQRYRLAPETVSDGLLVHTPATLGYAGRFVPVGEVGSFVVGRGDADVTNGLTIEFDAIPMRPASTAG